MTRTTEAAETMKSRSDIPHELLTRAREIDPSLAAWLEAAYPTDAEHARQSRERRRRQMVLKFGEAT